VEDGFFAGGSDFEGGAGLFEAVVAEVGGAVEIAGGAGDEAGDGIGAVDGGVAPLEGVEDGFVAGGVEFEDGTALELAGVFAVVTAAFGGSVEIAVAVGEQRRNGTGAVGGGGAEGVEEREVSGGGEFEGGS
jgi:hypothetical protein